MIGSKKLLSKPCAGIAVAAAGLLFAAAPVQALEPQLCAQHSKLVAQLGEKYGETVSASGFDGAGNFVEVFSSKNGTWTIAISVPGGMTCVIAAGEDWQEEKAPRLGAEVAS
ncbi:hypothetical protein NUH88_09840 [Nisaea acidiphila]|uniref:Uncharacterized protein n=1 Tax=Nisaea acidiphila TaxID=1862145 RepID=A0A9J7B0I4_9PROT|nr:hypothetical protein [Nisaea acidiphila]UUX51988.1 hypothetical protein NUH88_09840 [Nisaea acidiphila]